MGGKIEVDCSKNDWLIPGIVVSAEVSSNMADIADVSSGVSK